jgi:hypothetical protein
MAGINLERGIRKILSLGERTQVRAGIIQNSILEVQYGCIVTTV